MPDDREPLTPEQLSEALDALGINADAVVAAADLVGRSGAKKFEVGYLHDDVPLDQAGWYASAYYQGRRVIVEDRMPDVAADRLARQLMQGGLCTRCMRTITLGRPHPAQCRWWREGTSWRRSC